MEKTKEQQIEDLTAQNAYLENYFRNTIFPQLFFDKDMILRKFTQAAMKLFDLSQDDIGRSIQDIINHLGFPPIIHNIRWVMTKGLNLEKDIQIKDLGCYQMNIIPSLNLTDNEPNGVIITFVNITTRVKELKDQEKIIAEYETLLDTIAHDIKNRLSSMSLTIQLMDGSSLDDKEELRYYLDILKTGVDKINSISAELLAVRDQKHKYEAVAELVTIENILEDMKLVLFNEISTSEADLKFMIDSSEIVFSRRQLRSIFFNLINNAIKYRSPDRKPEIVIRTTQEDNHMVISVKDNGLGIDSKNLENIFLKYFRIEQSVAGSGVGLHLVKTLVNNAGGRIEVESELGVGTEFRVYLKTTCIK